MLRFAILSHDHPFAHWDLLLEDGELCRTWRLMKNVDSSPSIEAEEMFDHRLLYLDYEGPISGNRGSVICWYRGTFEWLDRQQDLCEVRLKGDQWRGIVRLTRIEGTRWLCEPRASGN